VGRLGDRIKPVRVIGMARIRTNNLFDDDGVVRAIGRPPFDPTFYWRQMPFRRNNMKVHPTRHC